MEKIKAFFQNKITKIVAWIVLALDIVVLFLGNVTESEIVDGVKMIFVYFVIIFVGFFLMFCNAFIFQILCKLKAANSP